MMRVFITGATGFVGSAVASDLRDAGYHVIGLARSEEAASALVAAGAESCRADMRDTEILRKAAESADAVLHLAFDHEFSKLGESCETDRRAIEALGAALEGSDKPFIVTSGLPVTPGRMATEDDVPPVGGHGIPRVSEQTAMALLSRGVRASVVRMPQVHDQEKQGFATYLLAHAREKRISAYVGEGLNRWPAVHRLDAARLYRLVLEKGAPGLRHHAVAEEGIPMRQIAEAIGRASSLPVVSLSPDDSPGHFGWLDRIAKMDVTASSALTKERLGWFPRETAHFTDDIAHAKPSRASA